VSRARSFVAPIVLGLAVLALGACAARSVEPMAGACPQPTDSAWPTKYWGLKTIDACSAWARVSDASSAKIAVLDSGIIVHPDLPGRVWPADGNRCKIGDPSQTDDDGHGTKVAGVIGGKRDGQSAVGVAWSARLLSYKFLCPSGFTVDRAMDAMRVALKASPDVVNASWTQFPQSPDDDAALAELNTLIAGNANVLFVFAAPYGIGGAYPAFAKQPNVLVVTASNSDDTLPRWAGRDKDLVHLAAPGVGIATSDSVNGKPGSTATFQGSSAAAAFVSGCAALVKLASSKPLKGADIANQLTSTAATPSGVTSGVKFGRLNCGAAVSAVP